jgi:uncharacterized tellurite resistance protein B-like protein
MQIPQELVDQFQERTGGEPEATARAIYDLTGNLGETYAAANASELMLFSRALGRPYEVKHFKLAEVAHMAVDSGSVFSHLDLGVGGERWRLQCSCWDTPELETIRAFWMQVRPGMPPVSDRPDVVSTERVASLDAGPALSPLALCCAAIHAMIECDDNIDISELNFLSQRISSLPAIQEGHGFYRRFGLDAVLVRTQKSLNGDQQRCLLANLVAVAMVDGVLRSREQDLIEQFRIAMGIAPALADDIYSALMARNNLSVFVDSPEIGDSAEEGLVPLVAFCAAVQGLMQTDQQVSREEREFLERMIPDPGAIQMGEEYLEAYGLEHLIRRLPAVLNAPQQRCLMANLLALALVQGTIAPVEERLLRRIQRSLAVSDDEYQRLLDLFVMKDDLRVFQP